MVDEAREIGGYSILETIDTRAFSVTYRAERRDLGRTARIKTLKSTVSVRSPFAALLEREAAVLARLEHEGILRLYDFARTEETVWLVLEDVRGVALTDVLRAGKVDPYPAAALALALALAVGHAHERGAIHRALRPAVVVVTPHGGLKIIEFASAELLPSPSMGAAHRAPRASPLPPESLEAGESLARPDYMAPEQILGETAGARSDVWSLGVMLHELLSGEKPFDAADRKAVAQRIRSGSPSVLPEGVPAALARVVGRCLAKAPEDRYEDARAVAIALEEALSERPRVPLRVLISKALAGAKLGAELAAPAGVGAPERATLPRGPDLRRVARSLGVVFGLIAAGGAAIQLLGEAEPAPTEGTVSEGGPAPLGHRDRGSLRVVARPWAEVYIDGELIDVTPIGRPIPVPPGRHFVTFRHPNAPDEQRSIKIAAGQTVLLDVSMRIERPAADAGRRQPDVDEAASP
jgi:serine/threonine-protein kinase